MMRECAVGRVNGADGLHSGWHKPCNTCTLWCVRTTVKYPRTTDHSFHTIAQRVLLFCTASAQGLWLTQAHACLLMRAYASALGLTLRY